MKGDVTQWEPSVLMAGVQRRSVFYFLEGGDYLHVWQWRCEYCGEGVLDYDRVLNHGPQSFVLGLLRRHVHRRQMTMGEWHGWLLEW